MVGALKVRASKAMVSPRVMEESMRMTRLPKMVISS